MDKRWVSVLVTGTLLGCEAKIDATKVASGSVDQNVQSASTEQQPGSSPSIAMGSPEVLIGQWSSNCVANPSNSLVSGSVAVYEFTDGSQGRYRANSYRDSLCEQRYTKADVDKLKVRLQEQATAQGFELSDEELKAYDVLWSPPIIAVQYKIGRKYTNGLTELDLDIPQGNGAVQTRYLSFFIDKGELYFAATCMQSDAQLGSCGPVAGDTKDNRGKKIDFNIAYSFKPLVKAPE